MRYLLFLILIALGSVSFGQSCNLVKPSDIPFKTPGKDMPAMKKHNLLLQKPYSETTKHLAAKTTSGTGPVFDTSLWRHCVDSTWGIGWSDSTKLSVLNMFWGHVDSLYPCFVHLPAYNWDSIVASMRMQITAGVSEGRYASMINYLLRLINDGHTNFYDYAVNYPNSIYQGLPLFRGESGLIGACVTTLHDTSAMVYSSVPGQRFGLEPGDIIIGYNGIPWTKLVNIILNYNLPNSVYKGSTDTATWHRYIQAAGENWYLFDTINIQKCNGTLVNLPTSLMEGVYYRDFCTEQMAIPGVPKPTWTGYYYSDSSVTYGVIPGTRIGYVYMYDCTDGTGNKLLNPVQTLVTDSMVKGLIIDIRTNFGGGFNAYIPTYNFLTSGGTSWVGYGQRSDPANRLSMYIDGPTSWYDITDADPNYFPYPIAILCGPNAVSAGDFFSVLFQHNPEVKLFGKSTAGAFGNLTRVDVGDTLFATTMQETNFFQSSDPSYYLSHTRFPVDSAVWFVRDSVCAGKDNIVTTAVQWIEGQIVSVRNTTAAGPTVSIFPNPANQFINLSIITNKSGTLHSKLYNMFGSVVIESYDICNTGNNSIRINIQNPAILPGNYYLQLEDNTGNRIIKKVAIIK